jgi:threonine dehydratase
MAETVVPNGTHAPETPKPAHASLALTEYSANPSPPSTTPRDKTRAAGVPPDFLLPTGYPDVSCIAMSTPVSFQ